MEAFVKKLNSLDVISPVGAGGEGEAAGVGGWWWCHGLLHQLHPTAV